MLAWHHSTKILPWSQFLPIDQIPPTVQLIIDLPLKCHPYCYEPTHICLEHEDAMRLSKLLC